MILTHSHISFGHVWWSCGFAHLRLMLACGHAFPVLQTFLDLIFQLKKSVIKCGRFQHHQWLVCFQPALNPNQKIYSSQNQIFQQHHLDISWYILIIHCYWTKRRRIFSRSPGKGKVWRQYHKFFCIAWIRLDFFVHWVHVLSRSWWHGFAPNSPNGRSNTSWYYIYIYN